MEINQAVEEAVKILREGGVILYPTDTIWGLGCDATNPSAVEKIYKIKNRTDSKSLIILVNTPDMMCRYVKQIPEMAEQLIEITDKPLTIIYPGAINLANNVTAEDGTVAIRVCEQPFCKKLISRFGKPIVSTSANISGEASPASFPEISKQILDSVDWIADPHLEEGATGKASSIIKLGLNGEVKVIRH